jgi:hypothetical protein
LFEIYIIGNSILLLSLAARSEPDLRAAKVRFEGNKKAAIAAALNMF